MTCEATARPSQAVVVLQYSALLHAADNAPGVGDEQAVLERQIEQAYGPDGLGLLTVAGVPGFVELRQQLGELYCASETGVLRHCLSQSNHCMPTLPVSTTLGGVTGLRCWPMASQTDTKAHTTPTLLQTFPPMMRHS